ncbi:MAG: TIM44-like domain-containing protein [Gammaproteobacteria bacterium]|nr:TIM44-like domain-containing protein [Gammaproteobacteria bacterium]
MRFIVAALIVMVVGLGAGMDNAEAKRLGGGLSFGGKKSFNQPFKRQAPATPAKKATDNGAGAGAATAAGAAGAGRAGLMGALGGLAMGGLLGALFFGGAFENINFLDILIFGLIAFVLFKLLAGRRRSMEPQPAGGAPLPDADWGQKAERTTQQRQATTSPGFDTDLMFKDKQNTTAPQEIPQNFIGSNTVLPKDINSQEFLDGAKRAFSMLQEAWDSGELADIRGLTTDQVFGEIQDQFMQRSGENRTEILEATAEIVAFEETDSEQQIAVLFNVNMRELDAFSGMDAEAHWVQEVWHFVKQKNSFAPTWFLDGIQQVEA